MRDPTFRFPDSFPARNEFKREVLALIAGLTSIAGGTSFIREVAVGVPVQLVKGITVPDHPCRVHRSDTLFLPLTFVGDLRSGETTRRAKVLIQLAHEMVHAVDFARLRDAKIDVDPTRLDPEADAGQTLWLEYRAERRTFGLMLSKEGAWDEAGRPEHYQSRADAPLTKVVRLMGRADACGGAWESLLPSAMPLRAFP